MKKKIERDKENETKRQREMENKEKRGDLLSTKDKERPPRYSPGDIDIMTQGTQIHIPPSPPAARGVGLVLAPTGRGVGLVLNPPPLPFCRGVVGLVLNLPPTGRGLCLVLVPTVGCSRSGFSTPSHPPGVLNAWSCR